MTSQKHNGPNTFFYRALFGFHLMKWPFLFLSLSQVFLIGCIDGDIVTSEENNKFGTFHDASRYSILRFFQKAYDEQGTPNIKYPICVYGTDGNSLNTNVQDKTVSLMNDVANEWNRMLYGLYGWPVESIEFVLINRGSQDCDLDNDNNLDRKWWKDQPTGKDDTEYHSSYPGLPVFRIWASLEFARELCGASQTYWINRMNISYDTGASKPFCDILGEAISDSANHIDVLLHEYGHQLGLEDTYSRGIQPESMMNNLWSLQDLTPDDIYGQAHTLRVVQGSVGHRDCPEGYYLNTSSTNAERCHPSGEHKHGVFIYLAHLGQCLEATSTNNGTNLHPRACNGSDAQKWNITQNNDGTYRIRNSQSGRCLDANNRDNQGQAIVQNSCDSDEVDQKFLLHPDESGVGVYGIQLYRNGNCLDLNAANNALRQRTCNRNTQKIQFEANTDPNRCEGETCWMRGGQGLSCDEVCESYNRTCEESMLAEINTPSEISEIASANGMDCNGTQGWSYAANPGQCTNSGCCGGNCVNVCTYGTRSNSTCSSVDSAYSRFCPCVEKQNDIGYCDGQTCWIRGEQGADCNTVCSSYNRTCVASMLDDINTADEITQIAEANGIHCNGTREWSYASNPGQCSNSGCCGGSCRNVCTYGTETNSTCSSANSAYSRFCPCQ